MLTPIERFVLWLRQPRTCGFSDCKNVPQSSEQEFCSEDCYWRHMDTI